ncbi:hypothetical protein H6S82_03925 [Planktothrix sp. FACHB-1355]|uniref:Uncharacterized protein n=1 Tax=Aerosakkonema funiforme FACHB-1375 TaxID=2949571 RepID=A0A926ZFX9_9CYAN|nr:MULTISPECIES: hypothetical protein [Oscillatoriales]MBD2181613.1 hypothetical protein [Aerosakkonema funiforme FACHB-1375]MBD3558005.1 hypothetical protein [Planktothrix sp. FACHB-1355]
MKKIFTNLIAAATASSAAVCMAIALEAPKAEAFSLAITNAGFEDPILGYGEFTDKSIPGWELYDPSGLISIPFVANYAVYHAASYSYVDEAPEGNNVGAIFLGLEPRSGVAGITQTLSSVLTAGTKYDLQVKVGNAAPDKIM